MIDDWHVAYRPETLDEVYGQEETVDSLKSITEDIDDIPHAFMFVGQRGIGKTTLGRIIAGILKCEKYPNLVEHNCGVYRVVEDTQNLISKIRYTASTKGNPKVVVIMDEIHMLSLHSFNALLKVMEEPPKHLYWILCTTEPSKIPDPIQDRCHRYNLDPIDEEVIQELLDVIVEEEKLELPDDTLEVIAESAQGSMRNAIVKLSQCRGVSSIEQVRKICKNIDVKNNKEIIDLCRMFMNDAKRNWNNAKKILKDLESYGPEGIRIAIMNYLLSCLKGKGSPEKAQMILSIMQNFQDPLYNQQTAMAELYIQVGGTFFEFDEEEE